MLPIISSAIEGPEDTDMITEFFMKYKMLLYNEAWKYLSLQEDVEDIVYEALTRIITNEHTFSTLAPLQQIQYAKVAIRNLSFAHLKRSSYFTMVPFEDVDVYLPIAENDMPEHIVEQRLLQKKVRQLWSQMPAEDCLLLEQKYILEWTDKELASALGIKPQSVRMRLTRAKRRIVNLLIKQGIQISDWL